MQNSSFSIYDASAGSGKTYALVKEYLKIILLATKLDAYRHILAITFTNKAVHEMKSRIVGNLTEFAKNEPNPKAQALMLDLSEATKLSLSEINTKSKQIIKHIIHNYAAFDILTIDKFTHKVIRAFAHDLNLSLNFEVNLETEALLTEAIDAIIAKAGEEEVVTKLLLDFTLEKTDDDKSWDISKEIFETGKLVLNENNREEISQLSDKTIPDFIEIKKNVTTICKSLEVETIVFAQEILDIIKKNGIDEKSFSRATFPNHIYSISNGNFNPKNKTFKQLEEVAINKNAKDKAVIENCLPEMLLLLNQIYTHFEKIFFYKAYLKNSTPLSLLNTVNKELAKIQQEQNMLSIAEFNTIIYNEIQNQPAPFIYERLGERYRHFFIDEFQDTSEMQWKNLVPLIDNSLAGQDDFGTRGTLMIVGDPKQSIYRWRGGKAEQFIALSKNNSPFANTKANVHYLDTNYRSYSEIIAFNNAFFKEISKQFSHPDYKDLYENHSHQKTTNKEGGFVSIRFLSDIEDFEEEELPEDKTAQYVLETLKTIQNVVAQGFAYKEIVILTRKREQGTAIASYLTEQNIPILSTETLMINASPEVQFIIYLLKYLKNASDIDAKARFLLYIAQNSQSEIPVHDFTAKALEFTCEKDLEIWLQKNRIAISFEKVRKKSLYEAVENIISIFSFLKKPNAYVHFFLDIVLEKDVRNQAGISDFLFFWEKSAHKYSIPSPEGNNAVKIMTIHKSKGLEFPVVIFPFAEEDYNRKPKEKLWIGIEEEENIGLPKVLIDNSSAVEGYGKTAAELYNQKKQEELLDNINVLYVALTRAEEQLYVISSQNLSAKGEAPKNNMCTFFVDFLKSKNCYDNATLYYEFGNSKKQSATTTHEESSKLIKPVLRPRNQITIKIAKKEALMWGTTQKDAIEFGNLIHEIMAEIITIADVESALQKALFAGLIKKEQKQLVHSMLHDIVTHPELLDFFEEGTQVLNEQLIIDNDKTSIIPDRIVLKGINVFLLDYKTGQPNQKHLKQLDIYTNKIEKMGFLVQKRALVYTNDSIKLQFL